MVIKYSRRLLSIASLIFAAVTCPGCATSGHPNAADNELELAEEDTLVIIECEQALQYLDHLIAEYGEGKSLPDALITEAQELRTAARALYLESEYDLALDFINDAIALLRASQ